MKRETKTKVTPLRSREPPHIRDPQIQDLMDHVASLQRNAIKTNTLLSQLQYELDELRKERENSSFIYVASPYSDTDPAIRQRRYVNAMWYTMKLLKERQWAYSPIVHCHEMAKIHNLPTDAQYWLNYNFTMLNTARELHVLCLPGWEKSVGVAAEVAFWRQAKLSSVKFIRA